MRPNKTPLALWLTMMSFYIQIIFYDQTEALTSIYDAEEDKLVKVTDDLGNTTTFYWHQAMLGREWTGIEQTGIWIYYSEENYRGNNVTVGFGENLPVTISHPLKSLRYAGSSRGSTFPAAILYSDTWFRGQEYPIEVLDDGDLVMVPNFRDMGTDAKSLIIVGSKFTFYMEPNFITSTCWCLQPTHYIMLTGGDEKVLLMASFYPDLSDLGSIGSLMLTCKNVPMKHYCNKIPGEGKNRPQCPILTNGGTDYCPWLHE